MEWEEWEGAFKTRCQRRVETPCKQIHSSYGPLQYNLCLFSKLIAVVDLREKALFWKTTECLEENCGIFQSQLLSLKKSVKKKRG